MNNENQKIKYIRTSILVLMVIVGILATSMSAAAADWPMFRNSASNSADSSETINLPLTEQWHSSAPSVEENGAVVSNGIVYMSTDDSKLYAFDVSTGSVVSGFPVTTAFNYGTPAVDSVNQKVYVLASTNLFAFNLNGTSAWTRTVASTGYNYNQGPIIDDGYVYLKDGNSLQKYNSNGLLQWSSSATGYNTQPAIMGDYVYVNTESGQIRKYDKTTGTEVITSGFPISTGSIVSPPAAINGKIFLKADKVYAYNASTGALIWSADSGGNSMYSNPPAISNGVVYAYGWDSKIYAFNENTGATITGFPSIALSTAGDRNYGSPAVAGDKIFIGAGTSQRLKVLGTAGSADAGQVLAEYPTFSADYQGFDLCSPIISDGVVFAMLDGGGLYAFFSSGTEWTGGAIEIDGDAECTKSQNVTLALDKGSNTDVNQMRISEDPLFAGAVWEAYSMSKTLTLSAGYGTKTVYVQFKDLSEQMSNVFNDQIEYSDNCGESTLSVTLNNPNGSETWTVGDSQNINWVASGGTGSLSVGLYYSTTGLTGTYSPIATGLSNTGSYSWTVPNAPSTNVFVKVVVTDASSNTANDASDAAFTIESAVASQLLVTINQIDNTSFGTITAYVSVTNQNNTPISGLTAANFAVTEDSTCTPSITVTPISTTGTPVSLAMTVDYSGSMSAANIADAKTGLKNFISLGGASDRFAIVKFSTDVAVVQDFTSNKTLLLNQVNSMPDSSDGSTSLYDSIYDSVTLVNSESHRKAVIAFTDGISNDDVHSLTETIDYAKANNVPVYTIGLGSVSTTILQQIASETGGVYYYAPTSSELANIYAQISEHIGNQYEITYQTCNPNYDGTYRNVEVSATYLGLTGSDTSGYYAPSSLSSLTVMLVTPTSGPVGTAISIGGYGFASGATVTVGGVTATSSVTSSTIITAIIPTLSGGTYDIIVTNPDGGYGTLSNAFTVTGMSVTSITPNTGIINMPTSVIIKGAGFQSGATVTVGGVSCTAVNVVSPTVLTTTVPTLTAGTYDIVVTNPDSQTATLTNGFTVSSSSGFFDNMESGMNGWTATGFWHNEYNPGQYFVKYPQINPTLVTLPDDGSLPDAYSGNYAWWYGENSTGTFIGSYDPLYQSADNGGTSDSANTGTLTSPAVDLSSVTSATLSFMTWWEIEGVDVNMYDMMYVEISTDNGATFTELGTLNPLDDADGESYMPYSSGGLGMPGQWYKTTVDISDYTGYSQVKVQFRFDTMDSSYNGFRGWLIDDVSIGLQSSSAPSIVVITPDTGPVNSIFSIGGIGFVTGSTVTVGGVTATSSTSSDTIIQSFVPASLSSGVYDVIVTNPDGQSTTMTDGFTVTTTQPPTVTAISPDTGVYATTLDVTITGTNFLTGAAAKIGTNSLTNVAVVSSTTLTGTIDLTGLQTGTHKVTVTNPDGQFGEKIGVFNIIGAPALVASVAPSSRIAQVGSSVTMLMSVINYGSEYAQDVSITQHTSLPITFTFKTWDTLTNFGTENALATIKPNNGVAFFVLEITPTSAFTASDLTFDIQTTNGTIVSAPITMVNTFLLGATDTASADIIMISTATDIAATVSTGGVFAIATSNVGNAIATSVNLVADAGTMPLSMTVKQIDPLTAAIIGDAQGMTIGIGETPTFAVFYTPTGAIANDPGNNRIVLKLVDGNGNVVGSQSVSIHT